MSRRLLAVAALALLVACVAVTLIEGSTEHPPAVDQQGLAGDEAAVVACEERDRRGYVLDLAAALDRLSVEHVAPPVRSHCAQ
jgi:hypothetical protein